MSLMGRAYKAVEFDAEAAAEQRYPELRRIAASKLLVFTSHEAGKGSRYVTLSDGVDDLQAVLIRFADHENTSAFHGQPDYNCVNRDLTKDELARIEAVLEYPILCKKTAFAKHLGLTLPKLKALLDDTCYQNVCENPYYENTFTQYVKVDEALKRAEAAGITARIPVAQERWAVEDYAGS